MLRTDIEQDDLEKKALQGQAQAAEVKKTGTIAKMNS